MTTWDEAQSAEMAFWGTCTNTFDEEAMQFVAAERMGLEVSRSVIQASGVVVDIGGGPVSLLLKTQGLDRAIVVDPAIYPAWTLARYEAAGIEVLPILGEGFVRDPTVMPDEIWIYNTLQHVMDPELIVAGAAAIAGTVRLFEWIEFELNDCHIHTLIAADIDAWGTSSGARMVSGGVEQIEWGGQQNLAFAAVFVR